jgi:hypothetical protein
MVSGTSTSDETAVLAAARAARAAENAAAAQVLLAAVRWAALHEVTDLDQAATWWAGRGQDTGIPIAGEGAPLVSEFAVAELATALGMSAGSGRNLLAQALELAHRLPRLWARVLNGSLAPWRARRVAEQTLHLTVEAADHVDRMLAPFAHKTGPVQTQRLVEEAIARFMPEHAAETRERAAEQRHVHIDTHQVSFAGTARIDAEVDLADAVDLEDAVAAGAAARAGCGSTETLDVRRSQALGDLARRQLALGFQWEAATTAAPTTQQQMEPRSAAGSAGPTDPRRFGRRQVVLYAHLTDEILRAGDPDTPVRVDGAGGAGGQQLLTAAQVAAWCGDPTTARVVVKPVVDLNAYQAVDGHEVPERIAEQVRLRDRTCVHPWCQRPASACDLDHIVPYVPMDQGGPPGQTNPLNLAPLCRLHHRMKTHGRWTYAMTAPGTYQWRSPHNHTYLRDKSGTTDLTPLPPEPPTKPGHPPEQ